MAPNERFETYGSKPEIRESRSDDILRHSPMHQNMYVVPAIARSEKARSPEARALPGLWSVWADAHDLDLWASLGGEPKVLSVWADASNPEFEAVTQKTDIDSELYSPSFYFGHATHLLSHLLFLISKYCDFTT